MRFPIPLVILALLGGAFAGCGGSSGGRATAPTLTGVQGSPEDRAAVIAEATRYPEFMEDLLSESSLPLSGQVQGGAGVFSAQAEITPITFTRRVRASDRTFEFAFADTDSVGRPTSATLTVSKDLTGTLKILAVDTTGGFNSPQTIKKPLSEHWVRRLHFVRVSAPSDTGGRDDDDQGDDLVAKGYSRNPGREPTPHGDGRGHGNKGDKDGDDGGGRHRGRWRLVSVSGIQVQSPNHTTAITSLRFESAGLDTTISDPLGLVAVERLPLLPPGAEVTITATTSAADDIVLLVSRDRRLRLQPNGGNTFTGTFTVPTSTRVQHLGVNALSHGTLFDDTAPYDSETWILPTVTGNESLAGGGR